MMESLPNARYERKFVVVGGGLPEVLAMVRRHPVGFIEAYLPRMVNNIYLDSPGLNSFFDHINGVSNRAKTRVRWYGDWNGSAPSPTLERKLKQGLVSGKISHGLPAFQWNGSGVKPELSKALQSAELPGMLREVLRDLEPSLCNRYRRHYFKSLNGKFRLTVDSDLQFGPPTSNAATTGGLPINDHALVIELKFDPRHAAEALHIGQHLPVRLMRCSKYVLGIEKLTGG